jgi:hypothetical protein
MKYLFILLFLFLPLYKVDAQTYQFLGSKLYGGNLGEWSRQLLKINENRLLIVGESNSLISGNKNISNCNNSFNNTDLWIVMVDTSFNIIWQNVYGGLLNERYAFAIEAGNGNIVISCMSNSDSSCSKSGNLKGGQDIQLFMIDSAGSLIWEKNFGTYVDCYGSKLARLADGNFVLLTSTSAGIGFDKSSPSKGMYDLWIVKFDSFGNIIYDRSYGGNMDESTRFIDNQLGLKIFESANGNINIFGMTQSSMSTDVSDTSFGGADFWMLEIDSLGNKLTDFCFGGTLSEYLCDAIKTPFGFLLVGATYSDQSGLISQPQAVPGSLNGWIISIDSLGNKLWDKRYQGGTMSGLSLVGALSITEASNSEYFITGTTTCPDGNDITDSAYGDQDAWFYKIDSIGNVLWDKRFGSTSITRTSNSVLMADSSIFLLCSADTGITDVKSEFGYGKLDYYLVHFRYSQTVGLTHINDVNSLVNLFPNPAIDRIEIEANNKLNIKNTEIYSLHGQLLDSEPYTSPIIDISYLPQAIYTIKIFTDKGMITKKFCKL